MTFKTPLDMKLCSKLSYAEKNNSIKKVHVLCSNSARHVLAAISYVVVQLQRRAHLWLKVRLAHAPFLMNYFLRQHVKLFWRIW